MGRYHAAKLAVLPDIKFVGCFDIVGEKAAGLAAEHGVSFFDSLDELANQVDAVIIAVPTSSHAECALPLLENGIAILLEKPIAPDVASSEQIIAAAERGGAVLQIGHSERFNPVYRAARSKIENPRFIETHRLAPFKGRGHDVAVILDIMIHDIDLLLDITGTRPAKIEAAGVGVITETFDIVNARLVFPSMAGQAGCVANITASRISLKEMRKLRVFQKSGYISMDLAKSELEIYSLVNPESRHAKDAGPFSRFQMPDGRVIIRENSEIAAGDNLQSEIRSFIEAVRGEHPPAVSGRDGIAALQVALQIEKLCADYQKSL